MYKQLFLLVYILIITTLTSCGGVDSPTPGALPTVTPIAAPTAVASAALSSTAGTTSESVLNDARTTLEQANYEAALEILIPLHERYPSDQRIASLLATSYKSLGEQILNQAQGNSAEIQRAFVQFGQGLDVAADDSAIRSELQTNKDVTELLAKTATALDQLDSLVAIKAKLSDQQAQVDTVVELLVQVAASRPAFIAALSSKQLLTAADIAEKSGNAQRNLADQRKLWEQSLKLCTWLRDNLPANPPDSQVVSDCVNRVNKRLNPPPTSTAAPLTKFTGLVTDIATDAAIRCGTQFSSSIYGSVENSSKRGLGGATIQVVSADGRNMFNVRTGGNGTFTVPGLGCTTWYVRLVGVPAALGKFTANRVQVSNLNGGQYTSARVLFRQQ